MAGRSMSGMYLSGPAICRLTLSPRQTVNDRLLSGAYGPTFKRGHIRYASLDGIEAQAGVRFTELQIKRAIDGRPGRIILHIPHP
jgi:hypothetical protein